MPAPASILVVDDDTNVRISIQEALAREGHLVSAAESGRAALERIAAQEFDVALVDLRLGDMSGMDVVEVLRQQAPGTAIIILTAYASLETSIEALRQGAHDYLFKPCKVMELRESVRTALLKRQQRVQEQTLINQLAQQLADLEASSSPAELPPRPLTHELPSVTTDKAQAATRFVKSGRLIIDLMRHVTTLEGHILELSPTEFALLAYLIGEAPRVIPSQELVRAVQGYECEPWEARETLRYHIHRIRRKAQLATGQADLIRTVRGVGYALN
jgi:DNA-binding response OmpR family regulator